MKVIDKKATCQNIRDGMERLGLTRTQMADRLDMSYQAVDYYYHGKKLPKLNNLIRISEILKIPLDELIVKDTQKD